MSVSSKSLNSADFANLFLDSSGTEVNPVKVGPQDDCPVCLDDMDIAAGYAMPCSHKFHVACLFEVIRKSDPFCPMCRSLINNISI